MLRGLTDRWSRWGERMSQRARREPRWRAPLAAFVLFLAAGLVVFFFVDDHTAAAVIAIAGLFVVGTTLAVTAAPDSHWGDLGRGLVLSAIISTAFGYYSYRQKVADDRQAFETRISLQKNLSGTDFRGDDLSGFQLAGKNLSRANLANADLGGANLSGARLVRTDLAGADLRDADLRKADLRKASLDDAQLSRANLFRADLEGATFTSATLTGTLLAAADLNGACLAKADLENAGLTGAALHGATLTGANLDGASFEEDYRTARLQSKQRASGIYLEPAGLARVHDSNTKWPRGFDPRSEQRSSRAKPLPRWRPPPRAVRARVSAISDGDTLVITEPGSKEGALPAQLLGVDAPPAGNPIGGRARSYLKRKLVGQTVAVVSPPDRPYDRFHRRWTTVAIGGHSVNEQLVARGYADVVSAGPPPPDELQLLKAEGRAKAAGLEVWRTCPPAAPAFG